MKTTSKIVRNKQICLNNLRKQQPSYILHIHTMIKVQYPSCALKSFPGAARNLRTCTPQPPDVPIRYCIARAPSIRAPGTHGLITSLLPASIIPSHCSSCEQREPLLGLSYSYFPSLLLSSFRLSNKWISWIECTF